MVSKTLSSSRTYEQKHGKDLIDFFFLFCFHSHKIIDLELKGSLKVGSSPFILWMKKLRPRKINCFAQGHNALYSLSNSAVLRGRLVLLEAASQIILNCCCLYSKLRSDYPAFLDDLLVIPCHYFLS